MVDSERMDVGLRDVMVAALLAAAAWAPTAAFAAQELTREPANTLSADRLAELEHAAAAMRPKPGALERSTSRCAKGDQRACVELGRAYERGLGVELDLERALELYRTACRKKVLRG